MCGGCGYVGGIVFSLNFLVGGLTTHFRGQEMTESGGGPGVGTFVGDRVSWGGDLEKFPTEESPLQQN